MVTTAALLLGTVFPLQFPEVNQLLLTDPFQVWAYVGMGEKVMRDVAMRDIRKLVARFKKKTLQVRCLCQV